MKKCRWCEKQYSKLAKSHIIPESFVNYDHKNDRLLINQYDHKKRRPIGSYDQNILCQECERNFNYIDSKAAEILLTKFDSLSIPFTDGKGRLAIQIGGKHLHEIKTFLMYTLWKASVSTLREFKSVNLDVFEDRIRSQIIENTPLSVHCYSFIAYKITEPLGTLMPYRKRLYGCN